MARFLFILSCLLSLQYQVNSQVIRSPLSYLSPRPYTDAIVELPRNFIDVPRNFIDIPGNYIDIPRNCIDIPRNVIDIPRIIDSPNVIQPPIIGEPPMFPITNIPTPTAIVTDCSPSLCKNLADTINLMIVSNLLQNTLGELKNLKVAASSLKSVMSNPALANYPGVISNLVSHDLIGPNFVAPKIMPNPVAPNFVVPNMAVNGAMVSSLLKMIGNTV